MRRELSTKESRGDNNKKENRRISEEIGKQTMKTTIVHKS
jgi:hypothetical protein